MSKNNMKNLIIIPTYNEMGNIEHLLESIFKIVPDISILIVDDNSPDKTGDFIDKTIKENKYNNQLYVIHRSGKLGLGTAYITGFEWAINNGFDAVISMDADFSHDPKYLPQMLEELSQNDFVVASRYVKGGGVTGWDMIRKIISFGGSLYARIVLLKNIHDFTGGFNGYKTKNLQAINYKNISSKGYVFQIEVKFRHTLHGFKCKEFPIIFANRVVGKSKISGNIFKEAVLKVLWLRLNAHKIKKQ